MSARCDPPENRRIFICEQARRIDGLQGVPEQSRTIGIGNGPRQDKAGDAMG